MPASLEEVKAVIREAFPGSEVDEIEEKNYRIRGIIRWKDFKAMEIRERNRLVTERVRNRLGMKGLNVDLLFPLAPGERLT